jgi:hypothetical protein
MDIVLIMHYEAVIADLERGTQEQLEVAQVLRERLNELTDARKW